MPVGKGYSKIDVTINPGETKEFPVVQNFKKSSLSPAVESIVSTGGKIKLHVSGTAYFKLLGLSIPIPFESTKQTSIVDEIKSRLNKEIQKNQQQQKSSVSSSLGQSLQKAAQSIADEILGTQSDNLDLTLPGKTIVNSVYKIKPGTFTWLSFVLPCMAKVKGGFSASAALGDNIIVLILDENGLKMLQNNKSPPAYYYSGKVESDTFSVTLNPGKYYFVLLNTYSTISTKTVSLQATESCV